MLTSSPSLYQIPWHSSLLSLHSSSAASPTMTLQSESPAWKWTPGSEDLSTSKWMDAHGQQLTFLFQVFCNCGSTIQTSIWECAHTYLTSETVKNHFVPLHFCSSCILYCHVIIKYMLIWRFNIRQYIWRVSIDGRRVYFAFLWTLMTMSSSLICSLIFLIVCDLPICRVEA